MCEAPALSDKTNDTFRADATPNNSSKMYQSMPLITSQYFFDMKHRVCDHIKNLNQMFFSFIFIRRQNLSCVFYILKKRKT